MRLRIVLILSIILCTFFAYSQKQVNRSPPSATAADARLKGILNFYLPHGADTSLYDGLDSAGALFFKDPDNTIWKRVSRVGLSNKWELVGGTGVSADSVFDGDRPITRDFTTVTGVNLHTSTLTSTIEQLLYPSQPPTATLSGGGTIELMATGAQLPFTINWSAGRLGATQALQTIVVGGTNETFSQPAPSSSVSGTQQVLVSRNINTVVTNVVTTTDGLTATATINYTFQPKRYFGFWSTSTPTDGNVQSLTSEFVTTRTKPFTTTPSTPTGSQYFVIAFPANLDAGNISTIWVNGLDQTGAFTRTTRAFTNASGYTQSYIFYTLVNPTAGAIQFEIK